MKEADEILLKMEQVKKQANVALMALQESSDADAVTDLVTKINENLVGYSIANILVALSFVVGQVLSDDSVLTEHEKSISLLAFYKSTKAAIKTIEDDD